MAIYVSTTVFEDGGSAVEATKLLLDAGLTRIELGSTHRPELGLMQGLKRLKATYLTHNFFPAIEERLVLNLASQNEENRKRSIAFMRKAIDFASELGAEVYTIHPGFLVDPVSEGRSEKSYDFNYGEKRTFSEEYYRHHMDLFYRSLDELAVYVEGRGVKLAIETQGSVTTKEFVMFSRPVDFSEFMARGYHDGIGINLNLSHTHLAAKVNGFDEKAVIQQLLPRIFAVEVSHSDGHYDDHKALQAGAWYFELLKDPCFKTVPLIVEARNVAMSEVIVSCELLDRLWPN